MIWTLPIILALICLVALFVVHADGRCFSKGLTRWLYDRADTALFSAHSETAVWRRLGEKLAIR